MLLKDRNEVCLVGKISRIISKENLTVIFITTGINERKAKIEYICPSVTFFPPHKDIADGFQKGDRVEIRGHVNSKTIVDEQNHGIRYEQFIVGETVKKSESELMQEFGIDSGRHAKPDNKIYLSGTVYSIWSPAQNIIRVRINTHTVVNDRKRANMVTCTYFTRNVGEVLDDIRAKDRVCAVGTIEPREVDKNETHYRYDNILLSDFQKV